MDDGHPAIVIGNTDSGFSRHDPARPLEPLLNGDVPDDCYIPWTDFVIVQDAGYADPLPTLTDAQFAVFDGFSFLVGNRDSFESDKDLHQWLDALEVPLEKNIEDSSYPTARP